MTEFFDWLIDVVELDLVFQSPPRFRRFAARARRRRECGASLWPRSRESAEQPQLRFEDQRRAFSALIPSPFVTTPIVSLQRLS